MPFTVTLTANTYLTLAFFDCNWGGFLLLRTHPCTYFIDGEDHAPSF